MNGSFYSTPTFPDAKNNQIQEEQMKPSSKETTLESFLQQSIGKQVNIYTSYEDSSTKEKNFKGTIEQVGKDYLILFDSTNGSWYVFKTMDINYLVLDSLPNAS